MSEMLSRVTQAMMAAELKWKAENGGDDASCLDCPDEVKARAAIEALRNPSDDLRAIMNDHASNGFVNWDDYHEAMIDAVLAGA